MISITLQINTLMKAHHHPVKLMGCGFVLTAVDGNPQKAWDAIRAAEAEIRRIEKLISSWTDDSETAQINGAAGKEAVQVSEELFQLIARSLKVSQITAGAFDISGTLARYYWNFNKENNTMLSQRILQKLRQLINYKLIELNPSDSTVFLKREGMKIGFGGIGKGYAAERAKAVMQQMGIESGLINASGDLCCWGTPPKDTQWTVSIPDPRDREASLLEFYLPYGSVVTSGNYENYTVIDGKRLSHIVDPRTAYPVEAIKNVSVVCPNAEFADALATAISVLGAKRGIHLVNRLNGVECLVIDKDDKIFYSDNLKFRVGECI